MKAGVIIGSALAGAAAAAVLTMEKKEKDQVMDFLTTIKDKVVDLAEDLKDKLPGSVKDVMPESLAAVGIGSKESKSKKGNGVGNSSVAQSVKGMKGGKAKAAKKSSSTGRKSGR
jgi:hypothetical protein